MSWESCMNAKILDKYGSRAFECAVDLESESPRRGGQVQLQTGSFDEGGRGSRAADAMVRRVPLDAEGASPREGLAPLMGVHLETRHQARWAARSRRR
jgi:hypothetical protein